MSAAPLGRRQTRAALPATLPLRLGFDLGSRGYSNTPMPSARKATIRTCRRFLYVLDNQPARESRTIVAGSAITPPLPTFTLLFSPRLAAGRVGSRGDLRPSVPCARRYCMDARPVARRCAHAARSHRRRTRHCGDCLPRAGRTRKASGRRRMENPGMRRPIENTHMRLRTFSSLTRC
jgi:hypothetical protein